MRASYSSSCPIDTQVSVTRTSAPSAAAAASSVQRTEPPISAAICNRLGMSIVAATPAGYEPNPAEIELAGGIDLVDDPREAADRADVLYTDVWTSMGQEAEREARLRAFEGYQVNAALLQEAAPDAIVLHCLPAHYGEEITEDVAYGPRSAIWDEAENRLHAQKALLALTVA